MQYTLKIEQPIDIGQLDQEFRAIFGDSFKGLNGDETLLDFIFTDDAKVTEDAVVALVFEHRPRPNTAEQERKDALSFLSAFENVTVTDDNLIAVTQGLVEIVLAFRKIYFG